jgi:hypothetical protein
MNAAGEKMSNNYLRYHSAAMAAAQLEEDSKLLRLSTITAAAADCSKSTILAAKVIPESLGPGCLSSQAPSLMHFLIVTVTSVSVSGGAPGRLRA